MTDKPTLEMYLLVDQIAKGDMAAISPLWTLLFQTPVDVTRPAEDVVKDIVDRLNEMSKVDEPAKEEQPKSFEELMDDSMVLLERLVALTRHK